MIKILIWSLFITFFASNTNETNNLTIEFQNIKEKKGRIWLAVYDAPEKFMDKEKAIALDYLDIKPLGEYRVTVSGLAPGTYAVAAFHDLNGNNEMDQTFVGIPKEPYAFSKKLKSKWRAPQFEEVKFTFSPSNQTLLMKLEEW